MKIKKILPIMLLVLLLALELLPYGAVVSHALPEGGTVLKTYSCFSRIPFQKGNVFPLITAILTCMMFILSLIWFVKPRADLVLIWKAMLLAAIGTSIAPIRYLFYCVGSGAITVLLFAEYFLIRKYSET